MDGKKKSMDDQGIETRIVDEKDIGDIKQLTGIEEKNQCMKDESDKVEKYHNHEKCDQPFEFVKDTKKPDTTAMQDLLQAMGIGVLKRKKDVGCISDKENEISELVTLRSDDIGLIQNILNEDLEKGVKKSQESILEERQNTVVTEQIEKITSEKETLDFSLETVEDTIQLSPQKSIKRKFLTISIIILLLFGGVRLYTFLTEPKPPSEDVVAAYNGETLTKDELLNYINSKGYMDVENGEVHPIHDIEAYRQVIKTMAVQNIVDNWAKEKGITQKDEVKHDFKHLIEDVELDNLIDKVHQDQLSPERIDKWEIQKYYDENKDKYKDQPFNEVEEEIRNILAAEKENNFFPEYIEKLKRDAALNVNYDILKVEDPTETELRSFYEKNKEKYSEPEKAKIIEIKIDISGSEDETRKKANEALTKIKSGEGFENVAKRYSNGNSSDAYFIKRGEKGPGFEDKVFNLQTNEVSSIFKDGNSFYIIKVVEKQDRRQRPFSEVIDEIKAEAIKEKMNEQYELRKSEALFSIHGKTFTLGEFIAEFNELSPETQSKFKSIEAKKDLIEQVIAKQLLLEEAGDDSGDSVSDEEIEELKSQYISQILHKEEIDEKMSKITNEEAKKFYEENKKQFIDPLKAEISLIRVELGKSDAENTRARQKIDEALQKIKAGADFATIAKEYSEDFTASVGGEINEWIYDDDYLDPLLKKKIFSLQTGQVSNVFEYEGGYYIFKLRKKEEERQRNFDEVEEQIKEGLLDEKHHIREAELEDELLAKSQLLIYNSSLRKMLKEQSNNKK